MIRCRSICALVAAGVAYASASHATYDFTIVASSVDGPFTALANLPPSLDEDGKVAFLATAPQLTLPSIFMGSERGQELVDYVQISGAPGQALLNGIRIGSLVAGAAAFTASDSGVPGVYYGAGGSLTPLFSPLQSSFAAPAVNFFGDLALNDGGKLVLANAQGSSVLLQKNDTVAGGTIFDIFNGVLSPDINDSGEVAFWADIDFPSGPCDEAVMLRDAGGEATVIALGADEQCDWESSGGAIALSESGHVAFDAYVFSSPDSVNAAFVDQTRVWDANDPGFGDSASVEAIAVNDAGTPAFLVSSTSGRGVYTGADAVADKVLATGDPLCGSAVTGLEFHRFGFNGDGQVALWVALADSRQLVVRAEPRNGLPGGTCLPEPSAGLGAAVALGTLGAVIRRRARCPAEWRMHSPARLLLARFFG